VTTIQVVIFGIMLSWTPSLLLMAYFLWRAPLEPDLDQLHRDPRDQP
jgi:hypothetical protein